jgi:hypothetical protein
MESPSDPDARITKMKDGRTRLAHKAGHAVDLTTGALLPLQKIASERPSMHRQYIFHLTS